MDRHGGNIYRLKRQQPKLADKIIDFSANINPLGPPPWLRGVISRAVSDISHYPDPEYLDLKQAAAKNYGTSLENIVVGNGSTEILFNFLHILNPARVVIPVPSYIDYLNSVRQAGIPCELFYLPESDNFRLSPEKIISILKPSDLLIIGSPNNPTGQQVQAGDILHMAGQRPEVCFLVDESFLDFASNGERIGGRKNNIFTLNSLTKFYAIPGLRLGFAVFPPELAAGINRITPPWSVNTIADAVGRACLEDKVFKAEVSRKFKKIKTEFIDSLAPIKGLKLFPSAANFMLVKIIGNKKLDDLQGYLLDQGLIIRNCGNFKGLDNSFFRLAVKDGPENQRMSEALTAYFMPPARKKRPIKKTAARLMFQGTCSNAGKSLLTAALCRILLQDGIKTAPFKAQNMSLNSFVTRDGGEMGRAQVVQAQAAKIDPEVRMNPVLLKPGSELGSQVIVMGKAVGNMDIGRYIKYKREIWPTVTGCYRSLAEEFEAVILEGAGSPGEINLKQDDIVNMKMAEYAKAPVLLAGDIDRGGVYASFIGIMEVLEEWERKLVRGFVVNKFRGDQSLLEPAHQQLLARTGRKVLGVVPYLTGLSIPEEDSVSFKSGQIKPQPPAAEAVEIVVIDLPHISNFTDIEPFYDEPDVHLRVVSAADEFGRPDLVILPGSKNVFYDLQYLKDCSLAAKLLDYVGNGGEIIGICGGYMMLGQSIDDPFGVEGSGRAAGLGLLDIHTKLAREKRLVRREGIHLGSGLKIRGYEIHHGETGSSTAKLLQFTDGSGCGHASPDGRIWGTFLHGLFDDDRFRRWLIDQKRAEKGLPPQNTILAPYDIESSLDYLAEQVRKSLDMEKIYAMMGL